LGRNQEVSEFQAACASFESLSKELLPVEELLQEADGALYAAKAAGRNYVKVASPRISPADSDPQDRESIRMRH
jgi:hypothetical protein